MACAQGAWAGDLVLDDEGRSLVKTLSRPVDGFHWASTEKLGLLARPWEEPSQRKAIIYTLRTIDAFWQPGQRQEGALGNGLYLATDPVATRPGSRPGWVLIRFTLPKGLRFIDLRAERDPQLPPRSLERLRAAGCKASALRELLLPDAGLACRRIAADTLKALQLDAVLYSGAVSDFDHCPRRPEAAFLIVDGARFLPDGMTLFTAERPPTTETDPLLEDRLLLQALFKDTRGRGSRPLLWEQLQGLEPKTQAAEYLDSSILGCGTHAEDRFPDRETAVALDYRRILRRFELPASSGADAEPVRRAARMELPLTAELLRPKGEPESGPHVTRYATRETALDGESVDAIQFFRFKGEDAYGLKWVDQKCEGPAPARDRYCGMVLHPEGEALERRLKRVLGRVADYFSTSPRPQTPLRFALEIQRELLALQPFGEDGGRAAQAAADYVLIRAGLPPARLATASIGLPEERLYQQGLEALLEAVNQLRVAAAAPKEER